MKLFEVSVYVHENFSVTVHGIKKLLYICKPTLINESQ